MSELQEEKKSRSIEKSIYNDIIIYSKKNNIKRNWKNNLFRSLYISRIRSIYTNIKSDSYLQNTTFKERILNNEIDCDTIVKLTPYDIF